MTRPTTFSDAVDGVSVQATIGQSSPYKPMDLEAINGAIQGAAQRITRSLAREKFLHDLKLLRATLYALAHETTLEQATTAIEDERPAELHGDALLHGYLASQGWQHVIPIDGTKPRYDENPGLFGMKAQHQLGQQYAGDIIVSLNTGRTLLAVSRDAYLFEWRDIHGGQVLPRGEDRWWRIGNTRDDIGHDPNGEKESRVRRGLTIPAVPANLPAMLDTLTR